MTDEETGSTPELTERQIEILDLNSKAGSTLARIKRLGAEVDTASVENSRGIYQLQWMFDNVLTEEQREQFELDWLREINRQLTVLEGQARDVSLARSRRKLHTPGSAGLIVPGDIRRQGRQ